MRLRIYLALIILGIFALDQGSKLWAIEFLWERPPFVVLPIFNLVYVENTGVAFGFLANGEASTFRWLTLLTFLIIVSIAVFLWFAKDWQERLAFALLLGGALGNWVDRLYRGYVIDFIDLYWQQWHWPAFNVADMFINLGAGLLIYFSLRSSKK